MKTIAFLVTGLLSMAFCAAVGSAFAAAEVGTVGVTAINSGMTNTVVAISYKDLASGGDISVSNLVKTTNLTVGDQLARFNGTDYDTWVLQENAGVKYWQKNSDTFKLDKDGKLVKGDGTSTLTTMSVGTGIWLCRQSYDSAFYIYGTPSSEKSVSASGTVLVGNPTQTAKAPTFSKGPGNGDRILVPASSGTLYGLKEYQYSSKKKGWVTITSGKPGVANLPEIPAGTGFWYVGSATNTATITWN